MSSLMYSGESHLNALEPHIVNHKVVLREEYETLELLVSRGGKSIAISIGPSSLDSHEFECPEAVINVRQSNCSLQVRTVCMVQMNADMDLGG